MAHQPQLEALLRLKRSENPDAQFWERFDAELHQRMLRTLVQKEPWYRQLYYAFLRPKVQLFFCGQSGNCLGLRIWMAACRHSSASVARRYKRGSGR